MSNEVRADTPDPTKYFPNKSGMPGTMSPRAGSDGQSLGFDHNIPQKVVVDPGEEGGGFELDLAAVVRHKKTFNAAASTSSVVQDVASFYRKLSKSIEQSETNSIKEVPVAKQPNETFVPIPPLTLLPVEPNLNMSAELDRKIEEQAKMAAELKRKYFSAEPKLISDPDVSDYRQLDSQFKPSSNADTMRSDFQVQQQLMQQTNLINVLIERINILSTRPVIQESKQESKEVVQPEQVNTVAEAFAGLQIPFITSEKAVRPEYETYFEMSKMGTMAARYHAVVAGQSCLALIYDTRFVDGFQYLPPSLGEERITVSIPKLKQIYSCSSLGLHWSLGCLDVVIMILHKGDDS